MAWAARFGTTCTEEVAGGTYDFTKVCLCASCQVSACDTGYARSDNTIPLQVHPGTQRELVVSMQASDALSANTR